jgi:hypothetical protein
MIYVVLYKCKCAYPDKIGLREDSTVNKHLLLTFKLEQFFKLSKINPQNTPIVYLAVRHNFQNEYMAMPNLIPQLPRPAIPPLRSSGFDVV